MVEIDGILYILGGEDGERELISMESYDIYSRTWTKQPDLTMVRKVRTTSYVIALLIVKQLMPTLFIFFPNLLLQVDTVRNSHKMK